MHTSRPILSMRMLPLLTIIALMAMAHLTACHGEEHETVSLSADPESFPTMKTINVSTLISDSGYTRYHITTDEWLMFEEAQEPHWNFPAGIRLVQFDDSMHQKATFRADSAIYFSARKLWQFNHNVRMKNVDGDRFVTQQLFWDQNARKIYSDSFIHIERQDRILEGYGFESNETMTTYTIRRPSGIFPTGDFVSNQHDHPSATMPDSVSAATK